MNIPDYDLVDSLTLLIAQRLLRQLCSYCKKPSSLSPTICQQFNLSLDQIVWEAQGCEHCHQGYQDRFAIYELITSQQLNHFFQSNQLSLSHSDNLLKTAINAVISGQTSWQELTRVIEL